MFVLANWDRMGGLLGVLLQKDNIEPPIRLHGPQKVKHYLESVRPLADSDTMIKSNEIRVEELTYDKQKYEDSAATIHYIPLYNMAIDHSKPLPNPETSVDTAFLFELLVSSKSLLVIHLIIYRRLHVVSTLPNLRSSKCPRVL